VNRALAATPELPTVNLSDSGSPSTNTWTQMGFVDIELNAQVGVERQAAAVRIAAS
jgi:hypothetical protein